MSLVESKQAAKLCAIGCLAAIKTICSPDKVTRIVAMHGLVNSTSENMEQADAMNGASDLVVEVFGEIGKHTRTAVRVSGLTILPLPFIWLQKLRNKEVCLETISLTTSSTVFKEFDPILYDIINALGAMHTAELMDLKRLSTWYNTHTCLLGDHSNNYDYLTLIKEKVIWKIVNGS